VSARRVAPLGIGAAAVALLLLIVLAGRHDPYRLRLVLENASGLRAGSDVRIGDVTAGTVTSVALGPGDNVVAELELHSDQAPVGQNASVAIASLNLLGQKYIALDKGNTHRPAPSGFTIPRSRISTSTDLDQVLDVLDPGTRARLAILINEAGFAMTGRRADFNALLKQLPPTTVAATRLLEQLVSDNRTLADLVDRSDGFVAQIAERRHSLSGMVDAVGQTATTFAARRTRLRQTLARAPRMLQTLQRFLAELRSTTVPLGPAARNITDSAPALTSALTQIDPFRRAADPTLVQAREVAPALTRMADGATPVLRRATPTVHSLATFGRALSPLSDTLDHSIDNLLAVIHNWSRAIQIRDGLSHIFNAQLAITPETLLSLVSQLDGRHREASRPHVRTRRLEHDERRGPERRGGATPQQDGKPPGLSIPNVTVPHPAGAVDGVLHGTAPQLPSPDPPAVPPPPGAPQGAPPMFDVLDYLLGS